MNETLSRRENEVMGAIFTLSQGKERFLAAPCEILALLPSREKFDEEKLERVLGALELDGYFELIYSDRRGEKTYCIHMREAGLGYRRYDIRRRRSLVFRLILTAVCGILSACLGIALKAILS